MSIDLDVLEGLAKAAAGSSSEPWYTAANLAQWMGSEDGALTAAITPAAALDLIAAARERDGLRDLVARFVAHDDDARNNPVGGLSLGGLMDARDNTGVVYQSQALADDLTKARQSLAPNAGEPK